MVVTVGILACPERLEHAKGMVEHFKILEIFLAFL